MNPYNPGLEASASDRMQRRMREAENARLVASATSGDRQRDRYLDRARRVFTDFRSRLAEGRRRPRPA